ncbi:MAG: HTH domain-containing protein [Bacteroides sp.]|nr:HTH domain-containing protein [Bacteroides sp.]
MDFKTNKPIYQQIVDFCFGKILTREWQAEERVVSVRELSTQLAVNSRTVLKAYEYLQTEGIIYSERGMGYYLSRDAVRRVMKIQKKEFFDNQLTETFHIMDLLGVSIEEITERYNNYKKEST